MKRLAILFSCVLILVAVSNGCSKKEYDIFATLYGVVSDAETGEPVSGASVVLSPGGKTKTTGSDGRFEFQDLDARQYTITVQKTGYQTNRKSITAASGESTESNISLMKIK